MLTDLHIEERDHAGPELDAFIKKIADDPNALWLGGGDYGGLIIGGDPRMGDGYMEGVPGDRVPDYVKEVVVDKLYPIRDKCIGFGAGNHEWSLMQRYHRGVAAEIAAELGVQHLYLGQRGWAHVRFRRGKTQSTTLKIFWYHGWSSGKSKSRKLLQAERDIASRPGAHIHMLGHDHQPFIDSSFYTEETYYTSRGAQWRIRQTPRIVMNGGSWTYGQLPPLEGKAAKKASEMRNEMWKEKSNYRPEPPRSPVCHVHVDFGNGKAPGTNEKGRQMGLSFTTEMHAPNVEIA